MGEIIMPVSSGQFMIDGNAIRSEGLKEACPQCGEPDCYEHAVDEPEVAGEYEDRENCALRRASNSAIDGVESLVLSLVVADLIDPEDPKVVRAIEVSLDAVGNNM